EFLDLFNHRFISFFYRGWKKYRFVIAYEQRKEDRFTEYLHDLIGIGTKGLQGRTGIEDEALLFYSGRIAQRPRSAGAIEAMLSDYFGVKIVIEQFIGQWVRLEQDDIARFGNKRLGIDTVAGRRAWNCQSKFRVKIGPLSYQEYITFLPNGSAYKSI